MFNYLKNQLVQSKIVQRFMGFSIVGVVVTLFSMAVMYLFNELLGCNVFVTYVVAYMVSILLSFVLNNYFIFKSQPKATSIVLYYVIYIISMLLGLLLLKLFTFLLPTWNETLVSYMVIPFTLLFNFIFVSKLLKKQV